MRAGWPGGAGPPGHRRRALRCGQKAGDVGRGVRSTEPGDPLLEDGVELRGLRLRGAPEGLLGDPEAHREHGAAGIGVDLAADRLEEVREPLGPFGLGRWDGDQDDVGKRCDRVRPLDVERCLTGPAGGGVRARVSDDLFAAHHQALLTTCSVETERRVGPGETLTAAIEPGEGDRRDRGAGDMTLPWKRVPRLPVNSVM